MRTVDVVEARDRMEALLDEIEQGAEVLITRHEKAVARLVPIQRNFDREAARRAAEGLWKASENLSLGEGLTIRELIEEGRM
ncbi:MAG: type II toxin-antitoxin system Phd/YefM family antitoxin [Alphaproteobacteria bacterium]|nr:type II toxin-antitoxin system Phd/YefM family antitoxin [Alphaproteobacteria bacterium]